MRIAVEALADALVEDLFRNGAGLKGERLAIMAAGMDHGGWSRAGFRARVMLILTRAIVGGACGAKTDGTRGRTYTCELERGHVDHHQDGSVRWIGRFGKVRS